jgi:hypothetical protein
MHYGDGLNLLGLPSVWPEVDLKKGFIRLSSERTKTGSERSIHKTMPCFKRYNLVTGDEPAKIKWPEEDRITGAMDTIEKATL